MSASTLNSDDLAAHPTDAYSPRRPSRSVFVELRGLRHHARLWGEPDRNPLVMIHGAADASATFQFLVDALSDEWSVVAPDLRGYGTSGWASGYAFADYLADLDGLLAHLFGDRPVPVLGHSLGGNVACIYAGVRPERVSRLVSLDGFGMPDRDSSEAPDHLRRWLDSSARPPGEVRAYANLAEMAARLRAANPRLDQARALFLAAHLGRAVPGGLAWAFDPAHRRPFATMFRKAEWAACVARISAPVLWVGSGTTFPPALDLEPGRLEHRIALARATFRRVPDTGHNLHHDAPNAVAALVEAFLEGRPEPEGNGRIP
jgi:pimeloyl-ACP methyl ester carboxylesterase